MDSVRPKLRAVIQFPDRGGGSPITMFRSRSKLYVAACKTVRIRVCLNESYDLLI